MGFTSEQRLRTVPWRALAGVAPALDPFLDAALAGDPAERAADRALRSLRGLSRDQRAAVAEAVFGVSVWRRRLAYHLDLDPSADARPRPPRLLLAALLRDLGGIDGAEGVVGLSSGSLPPPRPPPDDLALRLSYPDWLIEAFRREVGAEAAGLADALDSPGPVAFRANALCVTPEELSRRLAADGVATRPGRLLPSARVVTSGRPNVYALSAHRAGACEVQDEASQLVGALVEAGRGETALDLCAGAGGKSLLLAAAVGGSGAVHAVDVDEARLARLVVRARRAGVEGIVRVEGANPPAGLQVDRALVDAPCSELGALRRGPDRRFRLSPRDLDRLPDLQLRLLARAARHLRPGGRLVYATCTFRAEENERVAHAFEELHPAFERACPALASAATTVEGYVRTWPHRHGCDGFFAAVWTKGG
jgi:16S rRNA (cytosine967-C5)-methyltransferase